MSRPALTERNRQIIEAVQAGKTFSEVADQLGISRCAVSGVCHRAGVKATRPSFMDAEGARLASRAYWDKPGVRVRRSAQTKERWKRWREDRA